MFIRIKVAAVIALTLGVVPVGTSQTTLAQESEPADRDTTEEIVVYGEKSVIVLRNELYRAEESFFTLYNSLNTNDDFDVECERISVLGERRKYHICRPKYALKLEAQQTREAMLSADRQMESWDMSAIAGSADEARARKKDRQMWAEIAQLVKDNPEMQKELGNLQKANRALDAEGLVK